MGIFDWFKKKETPAQTARRRIHDMSRERITEATTPPATSVPTSVPGEELPSLDASILAQPTTWGTALQTTEEPARNPADIKQKILDHLAEQPQKRQWKKADLPSVQSPVALPTAQEQELEQIRFDQVGADIDMPTHKKHG